jgi:tyrosyl-tRNA synthetase
MLEVTNAEGQAIKVHFAENSFFAKAALYEKTRMQNKIRTDKGVDSITLRGLLWTLRNITHGRLVERDMFQERIQGGGELRMNEMLYPVLQGVDSNVLAKIYGSCDLEIGGSDQTFNMLMGRDVMRMNKQPEQSVMSLEILEGLDGKEKMSKSLDNYVGIADEPNDMYGKIMSLPDTLIGRYFLLATYTATVEVAEIEKNLASGGLHPKEAKMRLAREIVAIYHGDTSAHNAETVFTETFSQGKIPDDVLEFENKTGGTIIDVLLATKNVESKTEARRLVDAGAVTHLEKDEKITDATVVPEAGTYRVGKHRFFKIV